MPDERAKTMGCGCIGSVGGAALGTFLGASLGPLMANSGSQLPMFDLMESAFGWLLGVFLGGVLGAILGGMCGIALTPGVQSSDEVGERSGLSEGGSPGREADAEVAQLRARIAELEQERSNNARGCEEDHRES